MKSILPIVLMTFSVSAYSQNKISYQYDAAGNRISREILFSQSQMAKKQNKINRQQYRYTKKSDFFADN